jgi:hypothetical protein
MEKRENCIYGLGDNGRRDTGEGPKGMILEISESGIRDERHQRVQSIVMDEPLVPHSLNP